MKFEFREWINVLLAHMNVRPEKHGEDSVTALDLKFVRTTGNDSLDLFHPDLKATMYFRSHDTARQADIDGIEKIVPNVRFPKLSTLVWADEIIGATVTIDYGRGGASNIVLADCKVNQFRLVCQEGGTVEITFRVQTSAIPDGALDKLGKLLDGETQIKLTLPEVKSEPAAPQAPKPPKGRATGAKTPEEALASTH